MCTYTHVLMHIQNDLTACRTGGKSFIQTHTQNVLFVTFNIFMTFALPQDNLDSVEALIKKHEDFEKTLDAQVDKMNSVDLVANKLMASDHYAAIAIANRRDSVLQRSEGGWK